MSKLLSKPEIPPIASSDPRWELVQRVAASQHFKTSSRVHDFLLYVAGCAIRGVPEEATEQHIGIHVFDRSPGYNSSEDSIVRTHARVLRQKLGEYFSGEGSWEKVVIEIPKGHYLPVFRPADTHSLSNGVPMPRAVEPALAPAQSGLTHEVPSTTAPSPRLKSRRNLLWVLAICVLLALAGGFFYRIHSKAHARSGMQALWHPFLSDDPPLVIYSNAKFVGDSKTGLRYATPNQQMPPDSYVDTYTGIGEVVAIYQLTQLFDSQHATFILKRSLLVTWDEAKLKNLIFIGSPAENPSLNVLPATTDFTMMTGPDFAGIVNHHPKPGEPAVYTRPEHPLNKDYAILALLPGVQQGKWTLVLSGLTTYGTQAAAEYVSHPDTVATLLRAGVLQNGVIHPFEALLQTTVTGGVPMETKLVTIRIH